MRQADVLCDIGGITFCDGREIFLLYNVLSILPAMLLKVPVVKLSQAMGPFNGRINRFLASNILPRCHQIFARGDVTVEYLQTLGLARDRWQNAADVAFGYDESFSLTQENRLAIERLTKGYRHRPSRGHQTVALVPSSLVMKKNPAYVSRLVSLIRDLDAAGHDVLLLPNATRAGTGKARNNDLEVIQRIVDELSFASPDTLKRVHHVDFDMNTAGIRGLMSFADLVVTSRFHGMVAALADSDSRRCHRLEPQIRGGP